MKKNLFVTILTALSCSLSGQTIIPINFDTPLNLNHVFIDNATYPNNKWQIGKPQKKIFKSAYSPKNVIVTDTVNSYPVNNTSVFIIKNVADGGFFTPHTATVSGYYYVNSDSLTDTGTIEFSPDNGKTWIDLINPGMYSSYINWSGQKPVLTGNSNGWNHFYVWLERLGPLFKIQHGDTVLYKFSFKSDAIQTNKDGLMYDDLGFVDYVEGISKIQNDNLISIYPNPSSEELIISETEKQDCPSIQIINSIGQIIYSDNCLKSERINIKQLNDGTYYLKYVNSKKFAVKTFQVHH